MKDTVAAFIRTNFSLIALLLVCFFIYIPSLSGDFVVDDVPLVKDNPYIRDISHVARFFTKGVWENSSLEIDDDPRYLPMVLIPMLLNYAAWGGNPVGYHVYALLLHLVATCLVYLMLRRVAMCSPTAATFGAAIFALQPTRVESVAWIIGSIEPLVTIFLLGALLAYQSFVNRSNDKSGWSYLILSLFCFQLALWSKETAIIFPLIVLAYDLIYQKRINWLSASLYFLLAAIYLVVRGLVLGTSGKLNAFNFMQFERAIDFALGYSELLIFPSQVPFYLKSPEHSVSSILGVIAVLVIIAVIGFSWRFFDKVRGRTLMFSLIWTVGFFWPAILMVFYENGFYYARWLYIPAVGVSLLAVTLYTYLIQTYPKYKASVAFSSLLIVCLYGFFTWKEIPSWRNDETFYAKVVKSNPDGAAGYCGLGQFYLTKDDYAQSDKNFKICLQKAKTPSIKADALVKLGTIQGMINNLDASENYLSEALRINPRHSEGWAGLGNVALMRGQFIEAISYYEKAISARPSNYEAAMNMAMAYDKIGQTQRAELIRRAHRK